MLCPQLADSQLRLFLAQHTLIGIAVIFPPSAEVGFLDALSTAVN